ncbi:glycerophosphodiester phosphodiesterase family protein [Hymenobacter convexus]|uniref:glycerophosphodiester phosphodiesterase family protein n=1 Tax=Hymenobacter sp. CA1UV-4 TaxID=3063782 RepID=UPI0027139029|nr:glycerophosphodiester phosphodiesterase family protein [Hymenobacter sp. CA1UV-4]MDO7850869.1 glycerophosphodiester phosphodiesterase family protein [Hymenobacter sp. CA1UV-4]
MSPLKTPEIHGHRGCRGLRPENTLPAFLHALELGVDVLEMDVVISADHQVVVSHEPWFNPLFCRDSAGQPIAPGSARLHNLFELDYAAIRQYDCGSGPHPGFPQQVSQPCYKPLLREVLSSIEAAAVQLGRPPVGYSIEIKSSPGGDNIFHPAPEVFLSLVLADLSAGGVMSRTTLLCFDQRILQLAHQQNPGLSTCLLVEDQRPWTTSINELGFVPTTFGPDFTSVTAEAVRLLRKNFSHLRLVPWTVNEISDMCTMLELRVDGITTDYPNRALQLFAALPV